MPYFCYKNNERYHVMPVAIGLASCAGIIKEALETNEWIFRVSVEQPRLGSGLSLVQLPLLDF